MYAVQSKGASRCNDDICRIRGIQGWVHVLVPITNPVFGVRVMTVNDYCTASTDRG